MIKKFNFLSFLIPIILFQFCNYFNPIVPLIAHFLGSKNTSLHMIPMFFIVLRIGRMIFAIPAGYLADIYTKKVVLCLVQIIRLIVFILFIKSHSTILLFSAFCIWGISESCLFGVIESYIYDELSKNNKLELFQKIISLQLCINYIGSISAALIGGYIQNKYGYNVIFDICFGNSVIGLISALFLQKTKNNVSQKNQKKDKLNVFKTKHLIILILIYALISSSFLLFDKLNKFLMQDLNFHSLKIGYIVALCYTLCALCSFMFNFIKIKISFIKIILLQIILLFIVILSNIYYSYATLCAIILFLSLHPIINISLERILQDNINSNYRTTIRSISSTLKTFLEILFLLICSFVTKYFGYQLSVFLISIILFFFTIIGLKINMAKNN